MKKIKLLMPIIGISSIAATAIPLASCSCSDSTKLEIKGDDVVVLGNTATYTASKGNDAVECTWSVDNEDNATISAEGLLTPKHKSNVVITATSKADSKLVATKTISIIEATHDWEVEDCLFKEVYGYVQDELSSTTGLSTFWAFKLTDGKDVSQLKAEVINIKGSIDATATAEIEELEDNYFNINVKFNSSALLSGHSLKFDILITNSIGEQTTLTDFIAYKFIKGIKINTPSSFKPKQTISTLSKTGSCQLKPAWEFSAYIGDLYETDYSNYAITMVNEDYEEDKTIIANIVQSSTTKFKIVFTINELSSKPTTFRRYLKFTHKDYPDWYTYLYIDFTVNDTPITYTFNEVSKAATVSKVECSDDTIVIPSTVDNGGVTYTVAALGDSAFAKLTASSITLPNTILIIGTHCFTSCKQLTSMTLPDSVLQIKMEAFVDCTSLKSLTIGKNVAYIGTTICSLCTSLESIIIDSANPTYSSGTNNNCIIENSSELIQGCKTTVIPSTVLGIANHAFGYMGVESMDIPSTVLQLGEGIFYGCDTLKTVTFHNNLTNLPLNTFYQCKSLESVTGLEGVTVIAKGAFWECRSLTSIALPSTLLTIGRDAFYECSALTQINIPASVKNIENGAFAGISSVTKITVDSANTVYSSKDTDGSTERNCIWATISDVPTLVVGCQNTTIPSNIQVIGKEAFYMCRTLTSITLPASVTTLQTGCFCGCVNLTSVTLNEGLVTIENQTFQGARISTITIPSTVKSIGEYAFLANNLKSATFIVNTGWVNTKTQEAVDVSTPELGAKVLNTSELAISHP